MLLITKHTIRLRVSHLHTRRHCAAGARPRTCGEGDGRSAAPDGHGSIHVAARHQPVGAPRRLLLLPPSLSLLCPSVRAMRQVWASTAMHLVLNHGQRWNRITEFEDGSGGQIRLPSFEETLRAPSPRRKQWTLCNTKLKGVLNRLTLLLEGSPLYHAHITRASRWSWAVGTRWSPSWWRKCVFFRSFLLLVWTFLSYSQ
jgi:hypothetical protein